MVNVIYKKTKTANSDRVRLTEEQDICMGGKSCFTEYVI